MNNNLDFVRSLISKKQSNMDFPQEAYSIILSEYLSSDLKFVVNGLGLWFCFYKNNDFLIAYDLSFLIGEDIYIRSYWDNARGGVSCELPMDYFNEFSDWQKAFYLKNLDIFQIKKHA